ncbi:MAG: DUF2135 domain-containing protein [Kiritimatiellae bacterium]|nr:DUF2135 domain-containing protein [Kiritimatiellia bacterium]
MTMRQLSTISAVALAGATALGQGEVREPQVDPQPDPQPLPTIEVKAGEPMQIESYEVKAEVRGLFATVATTIVFRNPNDRLLEGELVFPLPDRAAVCGFALDINGAMVDGVVVPKDEARVVFDSEVRRKIDPALVEHVKGNVHRTRIYPLPANGTRTIRLTYNAPISVANGAAMLSLRVPPETLKHLGVVAEVVTPSDERPVITGIGASAFAKVENVWRVSFEEDGAAHPDDIVITLPAIPAAYALTEDAGECGVWRQRAELDAASPVGAAFQPAPMDIYWDNSRSAAATAPAAIAALKEVASLGGPFRLMKFSNAAGGFEEFATAEELLAAVEAIKDYDGATSFSGLFAGADPERRKVLFTDGLETASDFAGERVEGLVAVVTARSSDMAFLRRVTGGRVVSAYGVAPSAVAEAVKEAFMRPASASADGDVLSLDVGPFKVTLEKVGEGPAPEGTARGRVTATAWAQLKMEELAGDPSGNEDAMLGLGRRYGLVGPKTSMLVLESLDQWLRYKIEPPETLPEMHERWLEAMKNRNFESDEAKRDRHASYLKGLWNERLEWWRRDFEKDPLPVSKHVRNDDEPGILRRAAMAVGSAIVGNRSVERSAARAGMAAPVYDDGDMMMAPASMAMEAARESDGEAPMNAPSHSAGPAASISVQPWNPDTPYLKTLKKTDKAGRYATYLELAKDFGSSPSFFLDCAGFFYDVGEDAVATRVISNLAEIKLENADTLRVMAWRLRQAGSLDAAIGQFRRIAALRPEDGQSFRDLAMTLAQRAKARLAAGDADGARADADEAIALYLKTAFTPWNRHTDPVCLFALEEMNAFIAWMKSDGLDWKGKVPEVPEIDKDFLQPLDTDVRIILEWDADNTDLDLHVREPNGEEAYYAHNRTRRGGMVSRDVTDGFGPEEYMIRKAPNGEYEVFVKYFASHQQTLFGPATATATIFTNWGRATEKSKTLSLRLEKQSEKVKIGAITFKAEKEKQ